MKKLLMQTASKAGAILTILAFFVSNVAAQSLPLADKSRDASQTIIQRLDAGEKDRIAWLAKAREGLLETSADWERKLLAAGGTPGAMTAGLAAELDKAYAERLASGFFADADDAGLESESQNAYTPSAGNPQQSFNAARFPELAIADSARFASGFEVSAASWAAARMYESRALAVAELASDVAGGSYSEYSIASSIKGTSTDAASYVSATAVRERSLALSSQAQVVLTANKAARTSLTIAAAENITAGLSMWNTAEALITPSTMHPATDTADALPSESQTDTGHTMKQSWLSYGSTQEALETGLMQRFLKDKDAWLTTAEAQLAKPDTEAQFLKTDADAIARIYMTLLIPTKDLGQVTAEHREAESASAQGAGQRTTPSSEDHPAAGSDTSTATQHIQKPNLLEKALQLLRAIVESEPMDKVESSNRGAATTPQGIKPGAMTNDSIDTADSNDAGAAGSAPASSDKPDNKPIKSKTNSREMLIDGEDRVETVREQATTRTAAVKEVETPAQAPHEEGMKIADDGAIVIDTSYDFTATDLARQLPQKKAVAAEQSQVRYDNEKAEIEKKLEELRVEAAKAGLDVFEYYNQQQNKLLAAQNNNTSSLETQVQAMKNTLALINAAKNYEALTKQESDKYVKTVTKKINEQLTVTCDVVSLSDGKLRTQVGELNKALLKRIEQGGNFAFSMLSNPENAVVTTKFGEAIAPIWVGGSNPWYEADMHTGIDIVNGNPFQPMDLKSLLFVETMSTSAGNVTMNVIGTDVRFRISHLDKDVTDNIFAGQTFVPGELITGYPKAVNGTSSGLHYHIDVTREAQDLNSPEDTKRVFVDPNTLKATEFSIMSFSFRRGKTIYQPYKKDVRRKHMTKKTNSVYIGNSDVPITETTSVTIWYSDEYWCNDTAMEYQSGIEWYVNTNSKDNITDTDDYGWIEYKPF